MTKRYELVVATGEKLDTQTTYHFDLLSQVMSHLAFEVTINPSATCEVHDLAESMTLAAYDPRGLS